MQTVESQEHQRAQPLLEAAPPAAGSSSSSALGRRNTVTDGDVAMQSSGKRNPTCRTALRLTFVPREQKRAERGEVVEIGHATSVSHVR